MEIGPYPLLFTSFPSDILQSLLFLFFFSNGISCQGLNVCKKNTCNDFWNFLTTIHVN